MNSLPTQTICCFQVEISKNISHKKHFWCMELSGAWRYIKFNCVCVWKISKASFVKDKLSLLQTFHSFLLCCIYIYPLCTIKGQTENPNGWLMVNHLSHFIWHKLFKVVLLNTDIPSCTLFQMFWETVVGKLNSASGITTTNLYFYVLEWISCLY